MTPPVAAPRLVSAEIMKIRTTRAWWLFTGVFILLSAVTLLNNAEWNVDYSADVAVDAKTPANSKVTPTGSAKVTGTGDGAGSKTPRYTDPVANDAAWKTVAW